jgi:TRAP-type transport system periplasmic protein
MIDRRTFGALLGAVAAPLQAAAPPRWRLATGYRADSFHGETLVVMARELAAAGLSVTVYANNSLHPLAAIYDAVREGRIEMGEVLLSGLAAQLPMAGADAVPFVVRSYDDARRLWQAQRPLLDRALAAQGLVALLAVPWPPQGLFSRNPVTQIADLKGQRMRTYNRTTVRIAELVGAVPVDVPTVQVGQALAEGRIDCMITSAVTGVENGVGEQLRYHYAINAWFPKNLCVVQAAALQALPPAQQAALRQAASSAEQRGWAASQRAAQQSLNALRTAGVRVEHAPTLLMSELRRLGQRFSLEWVREVGPVANEIFIPFYTQVPST